MARPAKYDWALIKKHYEAGMSQAEIVSKFNCPKSAISKRVKEQNWTVCELTNAYISDSIAVSEQKSSLMNQDVQKLEIADTIVDEKTKHLKLINDNATKLAGKIALMTDEVADPQDIKSLVDANDKLAITLKVADRHAPKGDINLTQNQAQQTALGLEDLYN